MKGIIWDYRGLGSPEKKKKFLREMVMEQRVDFIGLQETKK